MGVVWSIRLPNFENWRGMETPDETKDGILNIMPPFVAMTART